MADLDEQLHRARFGGQRARATSADRDAILAGIHGFGDLVEVADGREMRQMIELWTGYLRFDKDTRRLDIGVRPLPNLGRSIEPLVGASGTVGHPRLIERSVVLGRRSA